MATVYSLYHIRPIGDDEEDEKSLGLYSSRSNAEAAIERYRGKAGFRDWPDCFQIYEDTLDLDGAWTEGFITGDAALRIDEEPRNPASKSSAYEPVKSLPAEEAERRADHAIALMEATKPEAWFLFLYEKGLHRVLGQFVDSSPFKQVSPIALALRRKISAFNPDLSPWQVSQIHRAMTGKVTDGMIAKYLDFDPPSMPGYNHAQRDA